MELPASDLLGALSVCNEHRARLAKRLQPSSYYVNLSPDGNNKIIHHGCMCVCCRGDGNKIRGSVESSNAFLRERERERERESATVWTRTGSQAILRDVWFFGFLNLSIVPM